jgi:hypothetical protein
MGGSFQKEQPQAQFITTLAADITWKTCYTWHLSQDLFASLTLMNVMIRVFSGFESSDLTLENLSHLLLNYLAHQTSIAKAAQFRHD